MQFFRVFTVLVFALCAGTTSTAQQVSPQINLEALELERSTLKRLRRNPQQFLQQMLQQMFKASADGVVTAEALDLQVQRAQADQRAQLLGRVLRYDLNGDFTISQQEIARQVDLLPSDGQLTLATLEVAADLDRDGTLQQGEITRYVNAQITARNGGRADPYQIMAFDADGDGKVTFEEVSAIVRAVVDAPDFQPASRSKQRDLRQQEVLVQCGYALPSEKADVVLVGTGSGAFQSDVALGDQGRTTGVVRLDIDPGETPLYVIAFSRDPVIWDVMGHVERIERFVTAQLISGVSGLDPSRVALVSGKDCVSQNYSSLKATNVRIGASQISKAFDHPVMPAIVERKMGHVHLPSGVEEVTLKYRRPRPDRVMRLGKIQWYTAEGWQPASQRFLALQFLYHEHRKTFPGGIARLDAGKVLAQPAALKYDVLPQEAGLMDLILDGSVVAREDTYFHVEKPIARFPAEMKNGSSIIYVLGPSVPELPPGDPGKAKVLAADGVTCLAGPRCQ